MAPSPSTATSCANSAVPTGCLPRPGSRTAGRPMSGRFASSSGFRCVSTPTSSRWSFRPRRCSAGCPTSMPSCSSCCRARSTRSSGRHHDDFPEQVRIVLRTALLTRPRQGRSRRGDLRHAQSNDASPAAVVRSRLPAACRRKPLCVRPAAAAGFVAGPRANLRQCWATRPPACSRGRSSAGAARRRPSGAHAHNGPPSRALEHACSREQPAAGPPSLRTGQRDASRGPCRRPAPRSYAGDLPGYCAPSNAGAIRVVV